MIGKLKLARRNRGQTLVEVVVAFGLIGISLAAMMSLTVATKNLLYNSSDITKANTLAEEGIEIARHQRDLGCSFSDLPICADSTNCVSGTTNDFVIDGDTNHTPDDEKVVNAGSVGSSNEIGSTGDDAFKNFTRTLTIKNLNDSSINSDIIQDNSTSPATPYFQNDSSCNKNPISSDDIDCTNRYYYITVTVTGPNSDVTTSASTIMSKQ